MYIFKLDKRKCEPISTAALLTAAAPVVINGISSFLTGSSNARRQARAQDAANKFAAVQQAKAMEYNSLANQFRQYGQVGMNPNLMNGGSFEAISPVGNQPVTTPQTIPPQMAGDSISQALLSASSARNLDAQTLTVEKIRDAQLGLTHAETAYTLAKAALTEEEKENTIMQRDVLNATISDLWSQIRERSASTERITLDSARMAKELKNYNRWFDANLNKLIADTNCSHANAEFLRSNSAVLREQLKSLVLENMFSRETYGTRISNFNYENEGRKFSVQNLKNQNDLFQFRFGQDLKFSEFERYLSNATAVVQFFNTAYEANPLTKMYKNSLNFIQGQGSSKPDTPSGNPYGSGGFSSPSVSSYYE